MITYWQQEDGQFFKTKKDEINSKKPLWIVGDVISVVVLFGLLAAYIVPYFMEKNKNTGMNLQNSKSTNKNSNDKKPHNKKSKK